MNYWHLQMSLPHGRGGIHIDTMEMLTEDQPVIGTGEWDHYQCTDFKNELNSESIVCVRDGGKVMALCKVISNSFQDKNLQKKYYNENYRYVEILEFYRGNQKFPQPQGTLSRSIDVRTPTYKFIDGWYKSYLNSKNMNDIIKVLKYKKQIILQGPPGTGKTYTAKKIAAELTGTNIVSGNTTLTPAIIKKTLSVGQTIANASGAQDYYTIKSINDDSIELQSERSQPWKPKYKNIISKYDKLVKGEIPSNVHAFEPYELAVAKHLFGTIKLSKAKTISEFTIVQFHPSYTYEDFVRGISVKSEAENISYETENKVLASLAEEANANLIASKKDIQDYSKEQGVEDLLIEFSEMVEEEIGESGGYKITEAVSIIAVEADAFRYSGKWKVSQRMKFKDLIVAVLQNVNSRQGFKKLDNVSGLAIHHASYFFNVLDVFIKKYKEELNKVSNKIVEKPELKNYVLIIDEINRANLPSVLGELIYALEYRGEAVSSMYAIDDDNAITIPENLYIIGTMNTADRSVGHIDYAIKRRFAFVDMLPNIEVIDNDKAKELFNLVSELFTEKFLASDFDAKDVQLGHSYFLLDENNDLSDSEQLQLKLTYEIIPILNEYVKDGLLLENAKEEIDKIAKFVC